MYLARYDTPGGTVVQAGFRLQLPRGSAAAVVEPAVAELADRLEARADVATVVVRTLGRGHSPPLVLVAAPAAEEAALRGVLLAWYRLEEISAGVCDWLDDRDAFDAAMRSLEGPGVAITNAPVERDDVRFHPDYRLYERLMPLDRALLRQGVRASACFRFSRVQVRLAERAIRLNLVRLQRGWIPERIRTGQESLAQRFLEDGSVVEPFVVCRDPADAAAVFDVLARDSVEHLDDAGFSDPPLMSVDEVAAELLGVEAIAVPPEDPTPLLGLAGRPGLLKELLLEAGRVVVPDERRARVLPPEPLRVFVSYAHEDRQWAEDLRTACAQLRRDGWIDLWSDVEIVPGELWEEAIHTRLEAADVVLLIVSPDFMSSEFCYSVELRRAIERQVSGQTIVVPIHVRWTDADTSPFAALQALPTGRKPVASWSDHDEAWLDVVSGLRRTLERAAAGGLRAGALP